VARSRYRCARTPGRTGRRRRPRHPPARPHQWCAPQADLGDAGHDFSSQVQGRSGAFAPRWPEARRRILPWWRNSSIGPGSLPGWPDRAAAAAPARAADAGDWRAASTPRPRCVPACACPGPPAAPPRPGSIAVRPAAGPGAGRARRGSPRPSAGGRCSWWVEGAEDRLSRAITRNIWRYIAQASMAHKSPCLAINSRNLCLFAIFGELHSREYAVLSGWWHAEARPHHSLSVWGAEWCS
jgi:hypothetical protein